MDVPSETVFLISRDRYDKSFVVVAYVHCHGKNMYE
jgi:hypothetical protein